eukprot:TRINITY_DN7963_c0_g1_i1.p1 TRINITY_DN7963_c0_g1~~TRINITY_DN7963_c0_g1_i1.p1  ORF type:complete len:74 (-),score=18.79 TRINITY_DN7963_c0_g1_i1:65-286(-)
MYTACMLECVITSGQAQISDKLISRMVKAAFSRYRNDGTIMEKRAIIRLLKQVAKKGKLGRKNKIKNDFGVDD